MTQNVIWLDKSARAPDLENCFGEGGDWFNLTDTEFPKGTAHIVAHFTDLKENDHARVGAFKSALSKVSPEATLVVYSGDPLTAYSDPDRISKWLIKNGVYKNFEQRYGVGVSATKVNELKNFLKDIAAGKDHVIEEQTRQTEQDIKLAINLVAEVIAWLKVSQDAPPDALPGMKEFKSRLEKFGENGDRLVNELAAMVDGDIKDRITEMAEQKKDERAEAWKRAGML